MINCPTICKYGHKKHILKEFSQANKGNNTEKDKKVERISEINGEPASISFGWEESPILWIVIEYAKEPIL